MKKIVLIIFFTSILNCSFGQKKFAIKIYQNTDIFETKYYESRSDTVTKVNNINFGRITLAIVIDTEKGYTHEIEFLIPEVSTSLDNIHFPLNYRFRKDVTFDGKASSYSFRYELSKSLTNEGKRFAFAFGIGINPYSIHIEYVPNVSSTYYWSTKLYGLVFNMTPRMAYSISPRFTVDINAPLKIYDLRGESNQISNPAIPVRQQTRSHYSNIFLEHAYTIRFGLMYKLKT